MNIIELAQGSPEWHTHRAQHFNASECAAMLGISPYKTRDQLLREKATGITPDVDEATQRRFDEGHRQEAFARPTAEQHIGDELYPCVGVLEGTKLSASFDGLTMNNAIVWEHKLLNGTLIKCMAAPFCNGLPEHYRAQMEQQLLVSGAESVMFMASRMNADGTLDWHNNQYTSDPALRQRIIDGWAQFEKDLAAYQVQPLHVPKPTARAPESLPALHIQATGKVLASNLDTFKQQAYAVLDAINRDLQTDDDFAHAEITVKWCKDVEKQLDVAWQSVIAQTTNIADIEKTIKDVIAHTRNIRLELEKLTKAEKENRKQELVQAAENAIFEHCQYLNARLAEHDDALGFACAVPQPFAQRSATLAAAIKGLRSLDSMQSALNTVIAEQKIAADGEYRRIEANIKLALAASEYFYVMPDIQGYIETKATDDLKNWIDARIAGAKENDLLQRERAERERQEQELAEDLGEASRADYGATHNPYVQKMAELYTHPAADNDPLIKLGDINADNDSLIKLGDINAAIAPLSISADGLKQLGFEPAATDKAAKLYRARLLPAIASRMCQYLADLAERLIKTERERRKAA